MVLEDASAPSSTSSDFLIDSPPDSDRDPYSDGSPNEIRIDLRRIPRPLFAGPLRYNDAYMAKIISARVQVASQAVGRPLTQDEAMAMAEHTGRLARLASFGVPVGLAAGFYQAYATRASYRFPFFKMDQAKFDSNKLLALEGKMAQMGWHLARFSAYGALGVLFSSIFFTNYAAAVTAVRETYDPRLRDFNKALLERVRQHAHSPSTGVIAQPTRPRTQYGDDASPTATTGFGRNEQLPGNTDDVSGGQVHGLDDASPSAVQQTGDTYASPDGGSAWERLRKQAGSPGGSDSQFTSTTSDADGSPKRNVWAERRQAALQRDDQQEDSSDLFGISQSRER